MHGKGKLIYSNGKVYQGNFVNDIISGYGTIKNKNGQIIYRGRFKNRNYHGKGVLNDH